MQTLQCRDDSRIRSLRERRIGANMAIQETIERVETHTHKGSRSRIERRWRRTLTLRSTYSGRERHSEKNFDRPSRLGTKLCNGLIVLHNN